MGLAVSLNERLHAPLRMTLPWITPHAHEPKL